MSHTNKTQNYELPQFIGTEYDDKNITTSSYDNYNITTYQYDWEAKTILVA